MCFDNTKEVFLSTFFKAEKVRTQKEKVKSQKQKIESYQFITFDF